MLSGRQGIELFIKVKRNGERELKRGLNLNAEERSYLITAVVVACAIAARVISKAGIAADTMGLIRSVLYIGLYFVWGISIKKRVMQAQVQRYLTAIVGMMIFWFIVRTMKYFFVTDIDAKRQLWLSLIHISEPTRH